MIMEIAKAADVKLPNNYEKKLSKAAELFHNTYVDHAVIEPWSKKNIIHKQVMVNKILRVILTQLPRMLTGFISYNIDIQTTELLSL